MSVLIQILLPRRAEARPTQRDAYVARTRAELVERYDGITAYLRSPAEGDWTAPDGTVARDGWSCSRS